MTHTVRLTTEGKERNPRRRKRRGRSRRGRKKETSFQGRKRVDWSIMKCKTINKTVLS